MPRWDRRLRIVLDWTVALFFRPDITRVDLRVEREQVKQARHVGGKVLGESQVNAALECGGGIVLGKGSVQSRDNYNDARAQLDTGLVIGRRAESTVRIALLTRRNVYKQQETKTKGGKQA